MNKDDLLKNADIIARTLYGEARGEIAKYGITPLIAIAHVILNRYERGFAKSIPDVCLAPKQFSCWNEDDPNYLKICGVSPDDVLFRKCVEVAVAVLEGKYPDITDGCDHYHACYAKPYWAAHIEPKRVFGTHYFYRLRK